MSHSSKDIMKYFKFDFGVFDTVKALKNGGMESVSKSRIFGIFQNEQLFQ